MMSHIAFIAAPRFSHPLQGSMSWYGSLAISVGHQRPVLALPVVSYEAR